MNKATLEMTIRMLKNYDETLRAKMETYADIMTDYLADDSYIITAKEYADKYDTTRSIRQNLQICISELEKEIK